MVNLQRVRFKTVKSQIKTFFKVELWQELLDECIHLDRVIIKMLDDGDYTQEAANIEWVLRRTRPGLIFQIERS